VSREELETLAEQYEGEECAECGEVIGEDDTEFGGVVDGEAVCTDCFEEAEEETEEEDDDIEFLDEDDECGCDDEGDEELD
jgi:hypothetical protein